MNDSLDLHEITTVVAVALADSENGADERGWWPVLALTDEAHPIVFECNLNQEQPLQHKAAVGKHRNERFRPGYAVFRIDEYDIAGIPKEQLVTIKEVWSSQEQAEAEVAR